MACKFLRDYVVCNFLCDFMECNFDATIWCVALHDTFHATMRPLATDDVIC